MSAVAELGQEIFLAAPSLSPLEVLTALIADGLIDVAELGWPAVEGVDPSEIVHGWLSGISAESIPVPEGCAATGDDVQRCFDAVARQGPWLVGATVEIAGHMSSLDHASRIRLHSALELDRLRTGTPSLGASALVAGGFEREDATELWSAYQAATSSLPFAEWVEQHLSDDPTTIASSNDD